MVPVGWPAIDRRVGPALRRRRVSLVGYTAQLRTWPEAPHGWRVRLQVHRRLTTNIRGFLMFALRVAKPQATNVQLNLTSSFESRRSTSAAQLRRYTAA